MNKSISIFLFSCATMIGITPIKAQQEVIIGSGTSDAIAVPISKIAQGATELLYDGTEINRTGTIKAIGWNISSNPYSGQTTASVYMKMSAQSTVTSSTSINGYTLVYSGNIESGSIGWQNILLNTPFTYDDSTKNLMILIVYSSAVNSFNTSPKYIFTTTASSKASYSLSENYQVPWTPSQNMNLITKRPNVKLYFNTNLSVAETEKISTLKYYPNPVKNSLTISDSQNITSIETYNSAGQRIITTKPDSRNTSLDLSATSPGEYFIKVTGKNSSSKNIKIIKH